MDAFYEKYADCLAEGNVNPEELALAHLLMMNLPDQMVHEISRHQYGT